MVQKSSAAKKMHGPQTVDQNGNEDKRRKDVRNNTTAERCGRKTAVKTTGGKDAIS